MAAIFNFDEEEVPGAAGAGASSDYLSDRLINGPTTQPTQPIDIMSSHTSRLPINISRNSSNTDINLVSDTLAGLDMRGGDNNHQPTLSLTGKTPAHLRKLSVSLNQRLGASYEVGINHDYVSSFADAANCKGDTGSEREVGHATGAQCNTQSSTSSKTPKLSPDDFAPLKVLGQGAYGKVLLVRHKQTGTLFAQKQLKKASMVVEQRKIEQTKSERSILESVRHPYIVRLFYALQDQSKLYLILEYAQGGELFTHLAAERMFSEDVAAFYVAEMALALEHLHKNVGVVYRDLKPENCLLDADGHLVLTDFGLSKESSDDGDSKCNSLLGTPEYMAPEILLGQEYSYEVDWWSLGAVCYDLVTGGPPFTGNSYPKIVDKITKAKLHLPYYLSLDAKDFLSKLLKKDPRRRLGYMDMATKIKKHRFFRKLDWAKMEQRHPSLVPPIVPIVTDPELAENFSAEFTDMILSPDSRSGEFPATLTGGAPDHEDHFHGFSYTASHSFIESALTNNNRFYNHIAL